MNLPDLNHDRTIAITRELNPAIQTITGDLAGNGVSGLWRYEVGPICKFVAQPETLLLIRSIEMHLYSPKTVL